MSETEVREVAGRAREASYALAVTPRPAKDAALRAMADALEAASDDILAANADDLAAAEAAGTPPHLLDRLRLTPDRVTGMADGLRDVAALADPVGEVVRGGTVPSGLELRQVRVPFGVVGMIYEARPNVTADAAGICLKSGNAALAARLVVGARVQHGHRGRAPRGAGGLRPAGRLPSNSCPATATPSAT